MMKYILTLTILIETLLLGVFVGATYELYRRDQKSQACFQQILKEDIELKDVFGHKIDLEDTWVHAQAAVTRHYFWCMNKREK